MKLSDITILITSFLRPGYLADCLAGIKKNLPECVVQVVDDGGLAGTNIISMPFDSGLSAKRNAGVAAAKTPYILMGSDDFDFSTVSAREGIERMLYVMETHPDIDVAGGRYNGQIYEGNLSVAPGQYIAQTRVPLSPSGITPVDITVNYFLARTSSIRNIPWDERMKIGGEHGDWFLTLKDLGKKVVCVGGVNITTLPVDPTKEDSRYTSFRNRAKGLGHKIFLRKRGVSQFYGFDDTPPAPLKLPKFIVAVVACHKNRDKVELERKTWLSSLYQIDYKVFYGRGAERQPEADEVFLDVDDGYLALPAKMKAIFKWVLDHGYEYVYKVDDDVYVEVPRLITAGWQLYPYSGRINAGGPIPWASGACYWLNKQAMQYVANEPLGEDTAEDRWTATVLHKYGIHVHNEPRYGLVVYANRPPAWSVDISACICSPVATIEELAAGFEKGDTAVLPQAATAPVARLAPAPPMPIASRVNSKDFLDKKVQMLFKKFRYVVATIPNSSHYKQLCRIYPKHLEELVETTEGTRIVFVVEK